MGGLSLAVCVVVAAPLRAQEKSPTPLTDVGDLWREVRHRDQISPEEQAPTKDTRRFLVVAPTIGSKPSTGLTGGINGNMAFFAITGCNGRRRTRTASARTRSTRALKT